MRVSETAERAWISIRSHYPILIVAGVILWSLTEIVLNRVKEEPPGTIILRVGHWQLETGFREGIAEMAKEFQKQHPNVKVIQDAVPEAIYGQWLSTQFMGGTAPDILAIGNIPYQLQLSFYNRYCVPLTSYVNRVNPYNRGTEFANTPLRNTYRDGMSSGYSVELQEYMSFPVTACGLRVFYNKDLLRRLTGNDFPPKHYKEFTEICNKIARQKNENGKPYIPIVGSTFHFKMWEWCMTDILTYKIMDKADFNRDGTVGNDEMYVAVATNLLNMKCRPIAAKFKMLKELADFCQPGFTGLSRDEGVFLFAQKKAVFISTGTWDARGLAELAKGKFSVGVMDFPQPAVNDPEYGDIVAGPRYEVPGYASGFSINRTSRHQETALDFLMFMTSKVNNERFNKLIGWIPAIMNTGTDDLLSNFIPCYEGIYPNFNVNLGGETYIRYAQLNSLFLINQISFDEMMNRFEPFYREKGLLEFAEQKKDCQRGITINERFLTGIRASALFSENAEKENIYWVKYRTLTRDRQVFPEIQNMLLIDLVKHRDVQKRYGPYEYSPEVIGKIREAVRASLNMENR